MAGLRYILSKRCATNVHFAALSATDFHLKCDLKQTIVINSRIKDLQISNSLVAASYFLRDSGDQFN